MPAQLEDDGENENDAVGLWTWTKIYVVSCKDAESAIKVTLPIPVDEKVTDGLNEVEELGVPILKLQFLPVLFQDESINVSDEFLQTIRVSPLFCNSPFM